MSFYTVIDANNNIVLSRVTEDPNFNPGEDRRLLLDETPDYDKEKEYVIRLNPVPAGSNVIVYQVVEYDDSHFIQEIEVQRQALLAQTDWTQLPDVSMLEEKKQEYIVYRQSLRDINEQTGYPKNVIWPVRPE